ncbi:MAG: hypothetical protein AAF389_04655 [Gemmatimonadota bacterium]
MAARRTWSPFAIRAFLIVFCLLSSACARYVPSGRPGNLTADVRVGDEVRVYQRNGTEFGFEVLRADRENLYGVNLTVPRADVITVEIKEISVWRTVAASIGGAVAVSVGLLTVILLVSLSNLT